MKNILKSLTILYLSIMLVACSASQASNKTARAIHLAKFDRISAAKLLDECQNPVEAHTLKNKKSRITANVAWHKNCMGVDDMLVVAWPDPAPEKAINSVRALVEAWAAWKTKNTKNISFKTVELKIDYLMWEGNKVNIAFFKVKRINI